MVDYNQVLQYSTDLVMNFAPKILFAGVTLIIGLWIIGFVKKLMDKGFQKNKMKASLRHFLVSVIDIILKLLLIISVVSMLGVATTSFVAVLAAAGFAIGLALQGSLANFVGGVLILIFEPFKVGDYIDAQGETGTVDKIEIFNTVLKTPDNKTIIIPNGNLSNGIVTNYSAEARRRVDMTFGIAYESDLSEAKKVLNSLISKDKRVLKDPAPAILVTSLGDSSVNISARVWSRTEDYWGIFFDMQEKVKLEFDKKGISIPYPQMELHMKK